MTSFDTSTTSYGTSSAINRFFGHASLTIAKIVSWNDARVTRNALSSLSDRELEDIGLTRADIDAVAQSNIIR